MNFLTTILSPKEFEVHSKQEAIVHAYYAVPAGTLKVSYTSLGICEAQFVDEQNSAHILPEFNLKKNTTLVLVGTDFQVRVWRALLNSSARTTLSYSELAQSIGRPHAVRAVANACAQNKIAYFIPCHRVVQKSGKLGGYRWGVTRKQALLEREFS